MDTQFCTRFSGTVYPVLEGFGGVPKRKTSEFPKKSEGFMCDMKDLNLQPAD